jgi:hypothetical protein
MGDPKSAFQVGDSAEFRAESRFNNKTRDGQIVTIESRRAASVFDFNVCFPDGTRMPAKAHELFPLAADPAHVR